MSKTPYELRHELLMMAQSIITENLMNERIRLENNWNLERERASIRLGKGDFGADLPPFPNVPKIDVNQVIEMAKTLNNFVSNTGENKND